MRFGARARFIVLAALAAPAIAIAAGTKATSVPRPADQVGRLAVVHGTLWVTTTQRTTHKGWLWRATGAGAGLHRWKDDGFAVLAADGSTLWAALEGWLEKRTVTGAIKHRYRLAAPGVSGTLFPTGSMTVSGGDVFVSTAVGLLRLHNGSFTRITTAAVYDVAAAPAGGVWMLAYDAATGGWVAQRTDAAGVVQQSAQLPAYSGGPNPSDAQATVGADGSYWALWNYGRDVVRVKPDGTVIDQKRSGTGNVAFGIVEGPDRRVWVSQLDGRIYRFDTSGHRTLAGRTPNRRGGELAADSKGVWAINAAVIDGSGIVTRRGGVVLFKR